MRTEGRTNRLAGVTKLIVPLRNFANAPKNREAGPTQVLVNSKVYCVHRRRGGGGSALIEVVKIMKRSLQIRLNMWVKISVFCADTERAF